MDRLHCHLRSVAAPRPGAAPSHLRAALCGLLLAGWASVSPAQTVQLAKRSDGGIGTFTFSLDNLANASDSISTSAAGVVTSSPQVSAVSDSGSAVTVTEQANAAFALDSASCVDANAANNGNDGDFGVLIARSLTIPAARLLADAQIVCTFVNVQLDPDLALSKSASATSVASGGQVTYTLVARNAGTVDVSDALLRDTAGSGLSCTSNGSCSAVGGASCPGTVTAAALFGAGVSIPNLPAGGSVTIEIGCDVTATGQ